MRRGPRPVLAPRTRSKEVQAGLSGKGRNVSCLIWKYFYLLKNGSCLTVNGDVSWCVSRGADSHAGIQSTIGGHHILNHQHTLRNVDMARGSVLTTTNASNTRELMHRGSIWDIVLRLASYHCASIVLVDPVQLRIGVAGDITGHRHALTHRHALLLCWHKHLRGLWKETSRQDHLPEIHRNKRVDNQREQTKHMEGYGGAALSYLVNGRADVFPVVWPGHGFYGQLAAVWVKLVAWRVNGCRAAGRKSFVDSVVLYNNSSTPFEHFCIQFNAKYVKTQQKIVSKT